MLLRLIVCLSLLISACSHQPEYDYNFSKTNYNLPNTPLPNLKDTSGFSSIEKIKKNSKVKIIDSEFEKTITFEGFVEKHELLPIDKSLGEIHGNLPFMLSVNIYFIRSWLDKKTEVVSDQIYLTDYHYGEWRNWYSASDEKANELNIISIRKDVDCGPCTFTETIGIDVPHNLLTENTKTGFRIKLRAKDGSEKVITVTPEQINYQLEAIASKTIGIKNNEPKVDNKSNKKTNKKIKNKL